MTPQSTIESWPSNLVKTAICPCLRCYQQYIRLYACKYEFLALLFITGQAQPKFGLNLNAHFFKPEVQVGIQESLQQSLFLRRACDVLSGTAADR